MKKIFEKILKTKKYVVCCLVLILIVLAIIFVLFRDKKSSVSNEYIISKLEKAGELTTAKLTYKGITQYTDTGIKIISRSDFMMSYTAVARAGIDVSEVEVSTNNLTKTIHLKVPSAKILDVKVEPSSIKFYDEKFALFNLDQKEDTTDAIKKAEDKARAELSSMGILEMADDQAEALLKGLLIDVVPKDYKIEVTKID